MKMAEKSIALADLEKSLKKKLRKEEIKKLVEKAMRKIGMKNIVKQKVREFLKQQKIDKIVAKMKQQINEEKKELKHEQLITSEDEAKANQRIHDNLNNLVKQSEEQKLKERTEVLKKKIAGKAIAKFLEKVKLKRNEEEQKRKDEEKKTIVREEGEDAVPDDVLTNIASISAIKNSNRVKALLQGLYHEIQNDTGGMFKTMVDILREKKARYTTETINANVPIRSLLGTTMVALKMNKMNKYFDKDGKPKWYSYINDVIRPLYEHAHKN